MTCDRLWHSHQLQRDHTTTVSGLHLDYIILHADNSDYENMDIPETEKSQTESSDQDDSFLFTETLNQNESFQEANDSHIS